MDIKKDIQNLTVQVAGLSEKVDGFPEVIQDTFRKLGIDPDNYLEAQEGFSMLRKIHRTKTQLEKLSIQLIATMIIQMIVFLVISGFVVSYATKQSQSADLRDEKHIQDILDETIRKYHGTL